jgi:uncharacterized protein YjbI with pentapeptide repeats
MAKSDRPRSPFAGLDFSAQHAVRVLPYDEIERLLAAHRLYLETERRQGRRADFGSADLSGVDFAGLDLRRVKMDRAVLRGADLTGAHLERANLIGAVLEGARLDNADLSGARLSGQISFRRASRTPAAQAGYGVRSDGQGGASRRPPAGGGQRAAQFSMPRC